MFFWFRPTKTSLGQELANNSCPRSSICTLENGRGFVPTINIYIYEYMYMSPLICKSIITLLARVERVEIIFILKISTGSPHFGTRLAIQRDIWFNNSDFYGSKRVKQDNICSYTWNFISLFLLSRYNSQSITHSLWLIDYESYIWYWSSVFLDLVDWIL